MTPLTANDVADVIGFAVTRPPHVCLVYVLVKPTDQAAMIRVHRRVIRAL